MSCSSPNVPHVVTIDVKNSNHQQPHVRLKMFAAGHDAGACWVSATVGPAVWSKAAIGLVGGAMD